MDTKPQRATHSHYRRYDATVDRVADFPWGILLALGGVLVLFVGGAAKVEEAKGLLTAAGLFGIGHGIHRSRVRNG
jgi:hypothetical protein